MALFISAGLASVTLSPSPSWIAADAIMTPEVCALVGFTRLKEKLMVSPGAKEAFWRTGISSSPEACVQNALPASTCLEEVSLTGKTAVVV